MHCTPTIAQYGTGHFGSAPTGMTPRVFRLAAHGAQTAAANDTAEVQKSDTSWDVL
jgi:hypothetical protein